MAWFTKILGAAEVPGKVVDIAGGGVKALTDGIDELYETQQERTEARQKVFDLWMEHQKVIVSESSGRGFTRRLLAVGFMQAFIFTFLFGLVVWGIKPLWAAFALSMLDSISNIILAVVAFYFGPYMFGRDILNNKKEK